MRTPGLALAALFLAPSVAAAPPTFNDFDAFVEAQLVTWKTPGVAVVVIDEGRVLFAKGYGWRDLDKRLPMTARTVQPIGSVAKAFTTVSLANLVRQGKLAWDKPLREWMPEFRLADDALASQVTLRDALTHRSSFIGHDWAWYGSTDTREQLMGKLRHFELRGGLRERYQYSDIMYVAAGYAGGKAAGLTWEDLVRREILEPLSMKSVGFTLASLWKEPDHSSPYGHDESGEPARFTPVEAEAVGPAGGFMYASAEDMGRFLAMLAAGGTFDGRTIVDARDIAEITSPQMVIPGRSPYAELGAAQYGMGFVVRQYRGMTIALHDGNNNGWKTRFAFLPQSKAGVFVAYNSMRFEPSAVIAYGALDRLAGLPPVDWTARLLAAHEKQLTDAAAAKAKRLQARKQGTLPSRDREGFAGTYVHPGYGVVRISRHESVPAAMAIEFHGFKSALAHVHYDVFEVPEIARARAFEPLSGKSVQFISGLDGEIASLRFMLDPAMDPMEFKRR